MAVQKTLIIVESPKKARLISKFLGKNYILQSSVGHISDLVTSGKNNMGIDIENGFKPKYAILSDKKDIIKVIVKSAAQVKEVLLAMDDDREGEAIAFHLAEILAKTGKPIKRIIFREITKAKVMAAIKNPLDLNEDLYDAQQARRVLDRIVGFSVSPYLRNKFTVNLSAGRVQSVAVRLVVDREREIEAFEPEEYWNIHASLAKPSDDDMFVAKYAKKLTDGKKAKAIKNDLETDTYLIDKATQTEQKRPPAAPFKTSSMQRAVGTKYRFKAARTMKAAQSLYEAGMITYMRTDSHRCSQEAVDFCRQWLDDNGYEKPDSPNFYATKKAAQDAHEAIRPTDVNLTPKNVYLSDDEQKVYTIIWERFVASQMKPALYDNVNVDVKSSSGHLLKANGKTLKYKGWLEIAQDSKRDDKNTLLPPLKKGDTVVLIPPKVKAERKFTKPPSRYSEPSLVEELEKRDIGRPSTFATIMSKITSRNYVINKNNVFIPTDVGMKLVDELIQFFNFMEYSYTAAMENQLDKIADGKLKYKKMLTDFYSPFTSQLKKAYMSGYKDYGHKCDRCGKDTPMLLKHGKFGFYLACYNYPEKCKNTMSCEMVDDKPVISSNRGMSRVNDKVKCPNCSSPMRHMDGDFGPWYSCVEYPKCRGSRKVPWGKKCSECKDELYATIYQGKDVLFCMGYSAGCRYSEDLPKGTLANPGKLAPKQKIPNKIKKMMKS